VQVFLRKKLAQYINKLYICREQKNNIMSNSTELLLDYQEMAIVALRAEVEKLKTDNELLTTLIKHYEGINQ